MRRSILLGCGCALASLITVPTLADGARVRAIHASPNAPAVDVLVNDARAITDLEFTWVSDYANLAPDTYNFKVVPAGAEDPVVIEADLALDARTDYSIVAVDLLEQIEPLVLIDDNRLDATMARIRFVHASPNAPAVDIAVTDGPVLFPDVSFKEDGGYIEVPGGTYDLEVRLAGTDTVVLPLPGVAVTAERVYSVFAMGLVGSKETPLQAVLSVDAAAQSRLRAIHASPNAPNVDILVNDAPAFEDVPFTAVSPYAALPFDTYNIKVVPAGAEGPVVIEADLPLAARNDYSVLAVNVLDMIEAIVLVDDNDLDVRNARVRFVHASPNAPAVDVALANGGAVLFDNVSFKENGGYITVPGGTYDLEVRLAGTDTVVLEIPGVMLMRDTSYTAYAMGLVGSESTPLQAVFSMDDSCSPDLDDNGETNLHDLLALLAAWGPCPDKGACDADFDNDGMIGFEDAILLLSRWGGCP